MKILKRIDPPKPTTYRGECGVCGSELECEPHELVKQPIAALDLNNPGVMFFVTVIPACPVCFAVYVPMNPTSKVDPLKQLKEAWAHAAKHDGGLEHYSPGQILPEPGSIHPLPIKAVTGPEKPKRKR